MTSAQANVLPSFLPFAQRSINEMNIVSIDHCYSKPWSFHPDASNARPARLLFMEKYPRPSSEDKSKIDTEIDVEGEENSSMPMYDIPRAKTLMTDCERHLSLLRPDLGQMKDDWEDNIATARTSWTDSQNRLYAKVRRVLQADRLARLSIQGTKNEPIQRRLQLDKAAKRVRFEFANVGWDMTLLHWLHNLFLEHLRGQLLISYLEVLQTVKSKVSSLAEQVIQGTVSKPGGFTLDLLNVLLKKPWDPVLSSINHQKPKKLPGNPLLLLVSNPPGGSTATAKRHKFWHHQLSCMGKVVQVVPVNNSLSNSIANSMENMIASTRSKILEMKGHFPSRHIVLIGWHVGALVACQVALMETVQAVVCLGFPTMGVKGNRREIDDPIYNCKTPTLFAVGQHASCCCVDTLEDVREKLRVDTGLVVVGGADDRLRMSRAKKKSVGITQSLVDRCLMDEMIDFLGNVLSQAMVQPEPLEENVEVVKKTPRKRKQKEVVMAVGSQTQVDLGKQPSAKAWKANLYDQLQSCTKTGSKSLASSGSTTLVSGNVKPAKKTSPKKRPKHADPSRTLSLKYQPLPSTSNPTVAALSAKGSASTVPTASEAAAIASAPELSNLLQSMKPTDTSSIFATSISSPSILSPSAVMPSTVATSTSVALAKLLVSSSTSKTLTSCTESSFLSKTRTEDTKSSISQSRTQPLPSPSSSDNFKPQQTQILIRPASSTSSLSPSLTFSMANKLLKASPIMKIMPGQPQTSSSDTSSKQPTPISSPSLVTRILGTAPDTHQISKFAPPASQSLFSTPSASLLMKTAADSVMATTSGDGDLVQMKETPPTVSSAPVTVSIDLGQLSSSTSSMKIGPSKISLMPNLKQVFTTSPLASGSSSTPATSEPSLLSILSGSSANSLQSKNIPFFATVPKTLFSPQDTSTVKPSPANSPVKSFEKNLTLMSSSQLLSSLSSNSGLITLKVSPQQDKSLANAGQNKINTIDKIAQIGKLPTSSSKASSLLLNTPNLGNFSLSVAEKITPTDATHRTQSIASCAPSQKPTTSTTSAYSTSLVITSAAVPSVLSPGTAPFVLQCKFGAADSSAPKASKPSSPKVMLVGSQEPLGQVTSLLESSPVTVGDQSKQMPTPAPLSPTSLASGEKATIKSSVASSQLTPSTRATKSTISSYTAVSKPVLPTVASTRTRRIKTPKQYDL